jgi:hypothetical protein
MTIDSLAHDAEVEAEVLRAVAHMPPARAQEFLIAIVLKIRRAAPVVVVAPISTEPRLPVALVPPPPVSAPRLMASVIQPRIKAGLPRDVVRFLRGRGEATAADILDGVGKRYGTERSNAMSTLAYMVRRGILTRRDGVEGFLYRLTEAMTEST